MSKWPKRKGTRAIIFAGIVFLIYLASTSYSESERGRPIRPGGRRSSYHRKLASVRPHETPDNSHTFGVADQIYVISPSRNDERRKVVDTLAKALDFEFTYVNATDNITPGEGKEIVESILDRIRWQRPRIDERVAGPKDQPESKEEETSNFIMSAFPFAWSKDAMENVEDPLAKPLGISGADYWSLQPPHKSWEQRHPLPKLTLDERAAKIQQASRTNNIIKRSFIATSQIATWHSNVRVLRDVVEKKHRTAIVFDDTIDLEWDTEYQLRRMWHALPPTWDIVYIGHCASSEQTGAALPLAFRLRKTTHTLCTHAYAVSLRGASKILRLLRSPDYAYSRPIDQALKDLIQMHFLESYSVYPPLAISTKVEMSNLKNGIRGEELDAMRVRGETLVDSTLERVGMLFGEKKGPDPVEAEWEEYEPY